MSTSVVITGAPIHCIQVSGVRIYKTQRQSNMDSPTTASSGSVSIDNMSIVATLFPPKIFIRPRSLSNASSRAGTPVPSIAPSTPHLENLSPRSSDDFQQLSIVRALPLFTGYLHSRDILNLSQTTRLCRDLRTSHTFQRYLTLNGWDTEALVRRVEGTKETNGRPWMFLARSALHKDDILDRYASLPKNDEHTKTLSKNKKDRLAVEKFLRILIDVVTEHDHHNFQKLSSLANSIDLTLIQFVTAIPGHDWKARHRKTFIVAAFVNTQPLYLEAESDLEKLAETLDFESPKPPLSLIAARANFLYTYGCMSYPHTPPHPVSSEYYDPPHLSTSHGSTLPGLRQAIDRFAHRISLKGFYRKAGGDVCAMEMAMEPVGLESKTGLPFTSKDLRTLTATVSDDEGNPPWEMEGSVDQSTGVGKLKSASGMIYELWITPWGLTGQKIRGESKHLGYFVLNWV